MSPKSMSRESMSREAVIAAAYAGEIDVADVSEAVESTIADLNTGTIRVAEKIEGEWVVNQWIKQAIMLYFRIAPLETMRMGSFEYHDKIPVKTNLAEAGIRVVPPGIVRYGAYCEPGVIVMPGYVNIGARVGAGSMVDTWATVGSCAQIGANVHLSGGVGIGGVLEPVGARPVIVEDGAFIGSRSIIVEGTVIEAGAVIGANTTITGSTPIIDVTGSEPIEMRGRACELRCCPRHQTQGVSCRHLQSTVRPHHWPAISVDGQQDLAQ